MKRYKHRLALGIFALVLLTSGISPLAVAQERQSPAATNKAETIRQRAEWFYHQRAYPLKHIPAGARLNALKQLQRMLTEQNAARANQQPAAATQAPASSTQWTLIGPQPTQTPFASSPVSGRVTALAVDPTNANVVYLGAAEGGVWKTTDGGTTWTPLTDAQPSLAIGSIALDPSNPNTVYVGTGEENFAVDSYYGAGILKSTDGGTTWTQIPGSFVGPFGSGSFLGGASIGSLAVDPMNGSILLAGVNFHIALGSGIYRSSDGGMTWSNVLSGAPGTEVLFDPTNGNNAYAALRGTGVFHSSDAGQTWTQITGTGTNVLPTTNVGRIEIAIDPSNTATLYAGLANATDGSLLGLFKTTDGGGHWTQLTNAPPYCGMQCWYDNVIRVHPGSSRVIFLGGAAGTSGITTLYRSTDGGSTWTDISIGANGVGLHADHHALAFSSGGATLYAGNDGGVWSTTNVATSPVNWNNLNNPLAITQFYPGISIDPTTVTRAFGGTQDNGTQEYAGSLTWNELQPCGDGGWTAIDFTTPSTVYAACTKLNSPTINKSLSGGATFVSAQNGINTTDRMLFIPPLVMDPSNSATLYFGTFRVYQSSDGATTWTAISPDLTAGGDLTTIAVAPGDSNTLYAGSSDSQVWVATNASAATGASWTNVSSGLPPRYVTQIAVDPKNSKVAYVTFSGFSGFGGDTLGHVFQSPNDGLSWADISGNLPNIPVNDVVVDPDSNGTLYVATDVGVFQTTNAGGTWSALATGLPRVAVLGLKVQRASRTLFAATHGRSAWDFLLPSPSGATAVLSTPTLAFGPQAFTTTSPPRTVTLTNTGNASLAITSTTINGDFAQTNNCNASLAAGASCTIGVTFTPTAAGPRNGTMSINDNAAGSPQTVALSGTGTDFAIATASGSSTSATVTAGGTATYTLALTGTTGFSGTVSLACSGAPPASTCTPNPTSVTLSGTSTVNATVSVATIARSIGAPRPHLGPPAAGRHRGLPQLFWWLLAVMLASLAAARRRRAWLGVGTALLCVLLFAALAILACGGGGGGGGGGGTPAGTYTLTVTGSSSTLTHKTNLTLTVQ